LLTRTRVAILAGMATISMLATSTSLAAAPAASASTLPSSATGKLVHELLSAWQITKGEGVTVAVLSNGVDPVSGLKGKVTQGPDYAPVSTTPNAGTALASAIASSGPSSTDPLGTIGRSPGARILSVKMVDWGAHGAGRYEQDGTWQVLEANAIRYAANHGAQVIVTQEYGDDDQQPLDDAVAYAMSKNAVVIGTGGSFGDGSGVYPDLIPGVINYSSSNISGLPGSPKNAVFPGNNTVLVTAPATPVFATCPGNQLCDVYGPLAGVAWVASTVALIKAVFPHMAPALVARALALSATYRPAGGYTTKIGFGLVNPSGALQEARKLVSLQNAAKPGAGVVSATAHFGSGPAPGVIDAVQHSPVKLAGYAAAAVVGLLLLLLARRWRRTRVPPAPFVTSPPPADGPTPPAPVLS
jgi:hypothetical protein